VLLVHYCTNGTSLVLEVLLASSRHTVMVPVDSVVSTAISDSTTGSSTGSSAGTRDPTGSAGWSAGAIGEPVAV
jgi:hypothetical protein